MSLIDIKSFYDKSHPLVTACREEITSYEMLNRMICNKKGTIRQYHIYAYPPGYFVPMCLADAQKYKEYKAMICALHEASADAFLEAIRTADFIMCNA